MITPAATRVLSSGAASPYNCSVSALLWFCLVARASTLIPEGRPAPPLEGQTLDGRAWADALTGQVTIVEFFATWCPQCRHSLADQRRLAATRQVRLIIVDVDEDPLLANDFFTRNPPPAGTGVLVDQSGRARANWGVTGFPAVFLIDEAGIIRETMSGWGEKSASYLAQQLDWVKGDARRAAAAAAAKEAGAKQAAAKQAAGGRRGRGKAAPPRERAVSPDEHARQLGVEVLR